MQCTCKMDSQPFSAANSYLDFNQDTTNEFCHISGTHITQHTISTFSPDSVYSHVSNDDLSAAVSMRPSLDNSFDKDPVPVHASYNFNDVSCNFISATKSNDNAYSFLESEENTFFTQFSIP